MKENTNIREFEGNSVSCPVIPEKLPLRRKIALVFFRFGACPGCIMASMGYSIGKCVRYVFRRGTLTETKK